MSDIPKNVFDSCTPLIPSGEDLSITVTQTLKEGGTDLLKTTGASTVKLSVQGPRTKLDPSYIAGVFPAPDSTETPDEYLPHIAISRRTLPWERKGPNGAPPWLALILLSDAELNPPKFIPGRAHRVTTLPLAQVKSADAVLHQKLVATGLVATALVKFFTVPNATLKKVLPARNEIASLCHMKRISRDGVDVDVAIVVCNRLPDASGPKPMPHTAFLVSLEGRDELYTGALDKPGSTALTVLHHWTFTPSAERDFEAAMQKIAVRPNGGVLRFGNITKTVRQGATAPLSGKFQALVDDFGFLSPALEHTQPGNVKYRGPLRPFPCPSRTEGVAIHADAEEFEAADPNAPLDYSHAAAFEFGRMLALSTEGILEDIREVHAIYDDIGKDMVAINKLPAVLQKPDWVSNPAWQEEPWSFAAQSLSTVVNEAGIGEVTGIAQVDKQQWQSAVTTQLGAVAAPGAAQVSAIDIGNVTAATLEKQFADLVNVSHG